jgi:hypothetical protein
LDLAVMGCLIVRKPQRAPAGAALSVRRETWPIVPPTRPKRGSEQTLAARSIMLHGSYRMRPFRLQPTVAA